MNGFDPPDDDDCAPDLRGTGPVEPQTEPNVSDAEADEAIRAALGGLKTPAKKGVVKREHREAALHVCSPMVFFAMTSGPPPGPAWMRKVLDDVAQAFANIAAEREQVDQNLDAALAFMQTDFSGDLDGRRREGYTRDRETTLLRAARVIKKARTGCSVNDVLVECSCLYGPEE